MSFSFFLIVCSLFLSSFGSLSRDEEQALLDWHNNLRSETAKGSVSCYGGNCPAGTIGKLKWDVGLASLAENVAVNLTSCSASLSHSTRAYRGRYLCTQTSTTFDFDCSGSSTRDYPWTGENLAFAGVWQQRPTPTNTINGWGVGEAVCFEYGNGNTRCTGDDYVAIGHYTQVVADRSEYVGCGCSDITCGNLEYQFCSCNYYPGGNFGSSSSTPYTNDGICGSCDSGESCVDSLCDDGTGDNFGTPSPTPPTSSPTDSPASSVTVPPDNGGGSGSTCSDIQVSGTKFNSFNAIYNCQSGSEEFSSATLDQDEVYGPVSSYNVYFYYRDWNGGCWLLGPNVGVIYYYAYCQCQTSGCKITDCKDYYDWYDRSTPYDITIQTVAQAYTATDSNNSNSTKNIMIGIGIGLSVMLAVVLIAILIWYMCKKREQNKRFTKMVDVEMNDNNEIKSDQDYTRMEN